MKGTSSFEIKSYDPTYDKVLTDLIVKNLYHTQSISPHMLVEGAMMK